jgi:hypothetical protein
VGTAAQGRLSTGGPEGSREVAGKAPAGIAAAAASCPAGPRSAILKQPAKTPNRRRSPRIKTDNLFAYDTSIEFNHLDINKIIIPRNHRQARRANKWPYWEAAEAKEIEGIIAAGCIRVEEVPSGATVIDPKWVYDIKTNAANQIIRFKAKLSARGDQLDFEDAGNIYSPVVSWVGISHCRWTLN